MSIRKNGYLVMLLFTLASSVASQELDARYKYFLINPFNAGINQVALTFESRKGVNAFNITAGYIYSRTEEALDAFGIVPANYIIANTYYAYRGYLIYPGYYHYLAKNPDSWLGLKAVLKYMFHNKRDLPWQWNEGESFLRRIQSDMLYVTGVELLYGFKTDFTKRFFYEIFTGIGVRVKFHNITVYDSYLDIDPATHLDPQYPYNEKYTLIRPTIHLGINLGLKI